MPVQIVLYQEADATCPVMDFLDVQTRKVRLQAIHRVELLAEHGYQLRRPYCDNLGGGLWELRWHTGRVQYRILYFFHGSTAVVLAHALTKEGAIAAADLERARRRKANFYADPPTHTHLGGLHA
jgi:phage-related protein